jgi:hypothetical protein
MRPARRPARRIAVNLIQPLVGRRHWEGLEAGGHTRAGLPARELFERVPL